MTDEISEEAVRHECAQGDAPAVPTDFGRGYVLPVHRVKLLERRFGHALDARIRFYEKPHVYTIDGRCASCSVTSLIKPYVEAFDALASIHKMKKSRREAWPRLRYAHGVRHIERGELDDLRHQPDASVLVVDASGLTVYAGAASQCPDMDNGHCLHLFDRAMTDDEILEAWNDPEATNRGTEAHYQVELWLNSEPARVEEPELRNALRFVREQLAPIGLRAHRTEWEVFAQAENVAGSVDFVGILPDGDLVLIDWKRAKKLESSLFAFAHRRMLPPFQHLEDCDGAKYSIQLSTYAWILERYYGHRVAAMAIVSIHPDAPFFTWVPNLHLEVDYLMAERRADEVASAKADASTCELPRCELTGRLATEAVRTSEGRLCNEKDLLVAHDGECEYAVEEETRRSCKRFVQELRPLGIPERRALRERAVAWKELMPSGGIPDYASACEKMRQGRARATN